MTRPGGPLLGGAMMMLVLLPSTCMGGAGAVSVLHLEPQELRAETYRAAARTVSCCPSSVFSCMPCAKSSARRTRPGTMCSAITYGVTQAERASAAYGTT